MKNLESNPLAETPPWHVASPDHEEWSSMWSHLCMKGYENCVELMEIYTRRRFKYKIGYNKSGSKFEFFESKNVDWKCFDSAVLLEWIDHTGKPIERKKIKFKSNMKIYPGYASRSMKSIPVKELMLDEIDMALKNHKELTVTEYINLMIQKINEVLGIPVLEMRKDEDSNNKVRFIESENANWNKLSKRLKEEKCSAKNKKKSTENGSK